VELAGPSQPELPETTLNIPKYDQDLRKNHNPQPAAPSITPDHPPTVPPVFPGSTAANAPAAVTAPDSIVPQTQSHVQSEARSTPASVSVNSPSAQPVPARLPPTGPTAFAPVTVAVATKPPTVATTVAIASSSLQALQPTASMVEVMTLSHQSDADAMVAALNRRGYNVVVSRDARNSVLHLDIGPFANAKDAEKTRQRLNLDGYDATIK